MRFFGQVEPGAKEDEEEEQEENDDEDEDVDEEGEGREAILVGLSWDAV